MAAFIVFTTLKHLTKDGGDLNEMLLRKVVTGINLEDEDVVHTRRPPPVNVDTNQKQEDDDQQRTAEQAHCQPQVGLICVQDT